MRLIARSRVTLARSVVSAFIYVAMVALSACANTHTDSSNSLKSANYARISKIDEGVYASIGAMGEVTPANLGRIGNAGFIVGTKGVLAIDAGVSHEHGKALVAAIKQVSNQPVKVLLVTHTMQEFLFGSTAFQAQGTQLWMHTRAADLMKQRCNNCLKNLNAALGEQAMRQSKVPTPDRVFSDASVSAELSEMIGRNIRVLYFGASSGPGDVAVYDEQTGVLFAGGFVESGRVPNLLDGDMQGWTKALAELQALKPKHVIAGHGPISDASVIASTARYLSELEVAVAEIVNKGTGLADASNQVPLSNFQSWDQYALLHPQNVHRTYLRLERKLFDEPAK
jgi:glyoxylase-like metal-dependent hydrolase (beta-lactamase superfamily II)